MKLKKLLITAVSALGLLTHLNSCKKINGIDNDNVLKTPYSMYITDTLGAVLHTNDAVTYKTLFPSDGFNIRSIISTEKNIVMVKGNVHVSQNHGTNFNVKYDQAFPLAINQSMMIDAKSHNRIYLASNPVAYSEDQGLTWKIDNDWHVDLTPSNINIGSLVEMPNGYVFGWDMYREKLYRKNTPNSAWVEVTTLNGLPTAAGAVYTLGRMGNTLIAINANGTNANGVYFSNNDGNNWSTINIDGPAQQNVFSICNVYDRSVLIGNLTSGVYRFQGSQFVSSNAGLPADCRIYGFTVKRNVYKNDHIDRYVFAATNKGLYRSQDDGRNWTEVKPGHFYSIY